MSLEIKIHDAQTSILRELLFVTSAGYAELQKPTGLTSDHFNFHIGRLVELGLVDKVGRGQYRLSTQGKEYANKLDTDNHTIERQPKVAVLLAIERVIDGERQLLFQERLKNPYFGYWGLPSGKVRWGETLLETAARELEEETGLKAKHRILGLYHEHATIAETDQLVEDKLFFMVHCTDLSGELIERFEGGRNKWMSIEEARNLDKRFGSFETEIDMIEGTRGTFVEESYAVSQEHF